MKKILLATLIAATLLLSLAAVQPQEVEAKKSHPPTTKQRLAALEANATAQHAEIDALQAAVAGIDLTGITNSITALGAQITDIFAMLDSQETRIVALEQDGGSSYDDTELRAEIQALKDKLQPVRFNAQGASTTFTAAPSGYGKITFAAVDNGNCALNSVDFTPNTGDFIQYGWCPQSQVDRMLLPINLNSTDPVIVLTIGNQQPDVNHPVLRCDGVGGNYTVNDGQTNEELVVEGIYVTCNASTRNLSPPLTLVATIDNASIEP